jgi:hypothetical protein
MNIGSLFSSIGHKIATLFGSHQAVIQAVLLDAQEAVGAAKSVAAALNEPASFQTVLGGVSDGLSKVSATVTAEASAETLTQHASDITALVAGLFQTTTDVGVKSAITKTAIGTALIKVNAVVGALETAATAASPTA